MEKSAFSSATVWGLLISAASTFGGPAVAQSIQTGTDAHAQAQGQSSLVVAGTIVGLLVALWGRWRKGDLVLPFIGAKKLAAVLVAAALLLPGCGALKQMIPHGDFHVGFAGLEVGYDTRPLIAATSAAIDGAVGVAAGAAGGISAGVATQPDPNAKK